MSIENIYIEEFLDHALIDADNRDQLRIYNVFGKFKSCNTPKYWFNNPHSLKCSQTSAVIETLRCKYNNLVCWVG